MIKFIIFKHSHSYVIILNGLTSVRKLCNLSNVLVGYTEHRPGCFMSLIRRLHLAVVFIFSLLTRMRRAGALAHPFHSAGTSVRQEAAK